MERRNVIRIVEPTDWISSMTVVKKSNGKLCICLDPQHLNKAIKREYYQLPTIEDIKTPMGNVERRPGKLADSFGRREPAINHIQHTIWQVLLPVHLIWDHIH